MMASVSNADSKSLSPPVVTNPNRNRSLYSDMRKLKLD